MNAPTVARNYAEALFEVGERSGDTERFADLIEAVAGAMAADETIRVVLESPRVPKAKKEALLAQALEALAPPPFVRFLAAVVRRGRQGLLAGIAEEYLKLVDVKFNRVHAGITLARDVDAALQRDIKAKLTAVLGKEVIPHFREDPGIIGGVIVRVGDRVMDGSLRRRILKLRKQMLHA